MMMNYINLISLWIILTDCKIHVYLYPQCRICSSPFTVYQTYSNDPECSAASDTEMTSCFHQCMTEQCCQGVSLYHGGCILAFFRTLAYTFVKIPHEKVPSTCISAQNVCNTKLGTYKFEFDHNFVNDFRDSATGIKEITAYINSNGFPAGLELSYFGGTGSRAGSSTSTTVSCLLTERERIIEVIWYGGSNSVTNGIQFVTNYKTCDVMGVASTSVTMSASGHMLLYLETDHSSGNNAFWTFNAYFDKC